MDQADREKGEELLIAFIDLVKRAVENDPAILDLRKKAYEAGFGSRIIAFADLSQRKFDEPVKVDGKILPTALDKQEDFTTNDRRMMHQMGIGLDEVPKGSPENS